MSVSFTLITIWFEETIILFTRLFGTAILVKNSVGRERNNIHDPFAVSVLKSDVIVGHVPRAISAACYMYSITDYVTHQN